MNQINKYFIRDQINKNSLKRGIEYDTIYNDSLLFILILCIFNPINSRNFKMCLYD